MTRKHKVQRESAWSADTAFFEPDSIEVLDAAGRPLLIMSIENAVQQALSHKGVVVALQNREGKIYVRRSMQARAHHSGLWDISGMGRVLVGESREDAALRILSKELGIAHAQLGLLARESSSSLGGNMEISLYRTAPGSFFPDAHGFFADREELEALMRDMAELATPALLWAASRLFCPSGSAPIPADSSTSGNIYAMPRKR